MAKQDRVLKTIDKNSLPELLNILEVPRARAPNFEPKDKKQKKVERYHGSPSLPRIEKHDLVTSPSKTPKISNMAGTRNITTRPARAYNKKPPMPRPSMKRNRIGISILTPSSRPCKLTSRFLHQTPLRLQPMKRQRISGPSSQRHYKSPFPVLHSRFKGLSHQQSAGLQNQQGPHEFHLTNLNVLSAGSNASDSEPNDTMNTAQRRVAINEVKDPVHTSLKEKEGSKGATGVQALDDEIIDDDMNCDSGDELSLGTSSASSSSSFEQIMKEREASHILGSETNGNKDIIQPNAKIIGKHKHATFDRVSVLSQQNFADSKTSIEECEQSHSIVVEDTPVDDPKVFKLMMIDSMRPMIDHGILGSTIGDERFVSCNIEDDSEVTITSSLNNASRSESSNGCLVSKNPSDIHTNPYDDDSVVRGYKMSHSKTKTISNPDEDTQTDEAENIEAWSIIGHSSSPFIFQIDGKKYGHPALPPGWRMRVSESAKVPIYIHPDHGSTWHCPIKLTPNMVYVRTKGGKMVKQKQDTATVEKKREPHSSENINASIVQNRAPFPVTFLHDSGSARVRTPPSARDLTSCENKIFPQLPEQSSPGHFTLDHDCDDTSADGLMQEISKLSMALMKNSSTNLEKIQKMKSSQQMMKQSEQTALNFKRFESLPGKSEYPISISDRVDQLLNEPGPRSLRIMKRVSAQDSDSELPSTMSGLVDQFEWSKAQNERKGLLVKEAQKEFDLRSFPFRTKPMKNPQLEKSKVQNEIEILTVRTETTNYDVVSSSKNPRFRNLSIPKTPQTIKESRETIARHILSPIREGHRRDNTGSGVKRISGDEFHKFGLSSAYDEGDRNVESMQGEQKSKGSFTGGNNEVWGQDMLTSSYTHAWLTPSMRGQQTPSFEKKVTGEDFVEEIARVKLSRGSIYRSKQIDLVQNASPEASSLSPPGMSVDQAKAFHSPYDDEWSPPARSGHIQSDSGCRDLANNQGISENTSRKSSPDMERMECNEKYSRKALGIICNNTTGLQMPSNTFLAGYESLFKTSKLKSLSAGEEELQTAICKRANTAGKAPFIREQTIDGSNDEDFVSNAVISSPNAIAVHNHAMSCAATTTRPGTPNTKDQHHFAPESNGSEASNFDASSHGSVAEFNVDQDELSMMSEEVAGSCIFPGTNRNGITGMIAASRVIEGPSGTTCDNNDSRIVVAVDLESTETKEYITHTRASLDSSNRLKKDDPMRSSNRTLETELIDDDLSSDDHEIGVEGESDSTKSQNDVGGIAKMNVQIASESDDYLSANGSCSLEEAVSNEVPITVGRPDMESETMCRREKLAKRSYCSSTYPSSSVSSEDEQVGFTGMSQDSYQSIESPVQPEALGKRPSYRSTRVNEEGSSTATSLPESPFVISGTYRYEVSRRILNPSFPICCLQRLDECAFTPNRKRSKTRRACKRGQVKKKSSNRNNTKRQRKKSRRRI